MNMTNSDADVQASMIPDVRTAGGMLQRNGSSEGAQEMLITLSRTVLEEVVALRKDVRESRLTDDEWKKMKKDIEKRRDYLMAKFFSDFPFRGNTRGSFLKKMSAGLKYYLWEQVPSFEGKNTPRESYDKIILQIPNAIPKGGEWINTCKALGVENPFEE